MATHDYIIANASGAAVRADLNNALAAIVSNNSNATAPTTTYAYQWWADTTAGQLKLRNATNDGWVVISDLDGGNFMQDGTAALPGLPFENDLNTGFFRPAADQLGISTNGVERVEFGTTEVVFNDDGADVDFRVEGDTEANLLYVDAGNEHVGIAEAAPGTVLEIGSTEPYVTLKNSTEEDTDGGRESRLIFEGEQSGGEISTLAQIEVSHDGTADDEKGKIVISTNDGADGASPTAALTISADQTVAVADNLTVNGVQYPYVGQLSNRNLIHNGAMKVAQRATSVTNLSIASYLCDRWLFALDSLATWTLEQSTDAPAGFAHSFKATCTTADASPGAGDYLVIAHRMEAQDLQHLEYGTSSAEDMVLSFYVKSNKTGAASFDMLQYDNSLKQFTKGYTINAANTWEHKKITIPGDTAGVIDNDTGIGLILDFWLNSGSTYTGGSHSAAWEAANQPNRNADNLGVGGAVSDYFAITGVQLELGSNDKSTPFEHRTYADDLAICQRYFLKGPAVAIYGQRWAANDSFVVWNFPVQMRDTPAITGTFNVGSGTLSTNFTDKNMMQQYIAGYPTGSLANNAEFSADF